MKNRLTGFLIFSVCALLLQNCAYNTREEAPGPQNACDNTNKYKYADVDAIFQDHSCRNCHVEGGDSPDLSDSTKIRTYINNNSVKFIAAIRYQQPHPMPKNLSPMPAATRMKLEAWICQGMK